MLLPLDATSQYGKDSQELYFHTPQLLADTNAGALVETARQELCESFLDARSYVREAMGSVPGNLEDEAPWLAQFNDHLMVMVGQVKKAEVQEYQEDECWFAGRSGEEVADSPWERAKKHNEAMFQALSARRAKWPPPVIL